MSKQIATYLGDNPHVLVVIIGVLLLLFIVFDGIMQNRDECRYRRLQAIVVKGPHTGRVGRIVSSPWIGNLYNQRITLNVAASEQEIHEVWGEGWGEQVRLLIEQRANGNGPRHWIKAWRSDVIISDE